MYRLQFRSEGSDVWSLRCPESRAPLQHVTECGVLCSNEKVAKGALREKLKQKAPFLTSLERLNMLFADKKEKDASKQTDHFMCWKCFLDARPFSSFHQGAAKGNSSGVNETHFTRSLLVSHRRAFYQLHLQQSAANLPPNSFIFPGRPLSAASSPGSRHLSPASGQNSPSSAGASPRLNVNQQQPPANLIGRAQSTSGNLPEAAAKARQILEVANKNQGASSAKELKKAPLPVSAEREKTPKKLNRDDSTGTKIKDKSESDQSLRKSQENLPAIVDKSGANLSNSDALRKAAMLKASKKIDKGPATTALFEDISEDEDETESLVEKQGDKVDKVSSTNKDASLEDVSDAEIGANVAKKNVERKKDSADKDETFEEISDTEMEVDAGKKSKHNRDAFSDISDDDMSGTTAELSDIHGSRLNSPEDNPLQEEEELQTQSNDSNIKAGEASKSAEANPVRSPASNAPISMSDPDKQREASLASSRDSSSQEGLDATSAIQLSGVSAVQAKPNTNETGQSLGLPKNNTAQNRRELSEEVEPSAAQNTSPTLNSSATAAEASATDDLAMVPPSLPVITVTSKPSNSSTLETNNEEEKKEEKDVKESKPKSIITVEPVDNRSPISVNETEAVPDKKEEKKKRPVNVKMNQFLNMICGDRNDSQVLISSEERRLANEAYANISRPDGVMTLHTALSVSHTFEESDQPMPSGSKGLPFHIPPTPPPDTLAEEEEEETFTCNVCQEEFNSLKDFEIHREMAHTTPNTFGEAVNVKEVEEHEDRMGWRFDMSKAGQQQEKEEAESTDESSDEDESSSPVPTKRRRLAFSSSSSSLSSFQANDYAADCEMSDEEEFRREVLERDEVYQGYAALEKQLGLPASATPSSGESPLKVIKLDKKSAGAAINNEEEAEMRRDGFYCHDCNDLVTIEEVEMETHPHSRLSYFNCTDYFVFKRVRVNMGRRHDQVWYHLA